MTVRTKAAWQLMRLKPLEHKSTSKATMNGQTSTRSKPQPEQPQTDYRLIPEQNPGTNRTGPLRVAIIYEDLLNGRAGIEIYRNLMDRLGEDVQFDCHLWNFFELGRTGARAQAETEICRAEILLLSLHGRKPMPENVRAWLGKMAAASKHKPSIVILMDGVDVTKAEQSADYRFFQQLCRQQGLEFYLDAASGLEREGDEEWLEPWQHYPARSEPRDNLMDSTTDYFGWGLNE